MRVDTPVIEDEERWNTLFRAASQAAVVNAFRLYREAGVEPILIKGWAAGFNYPSDRTRVFTDIDLSVAKRQFPAALKVFRESAPSAYPVDLHCELRHLDTLEWERLFNDSRLVEIGDTNIRILRPEDHLRVLCVHFLTDGAWYRERLWDIYYAVDRRHPKFDWARCLDVVPPRRRRWIVCTIGLAHRYLGLSLSGTPIEEEAKGLPAWLVSAVERQWARPARLESLAGSRKDRRRLLEQIRMRFPPEPIFSTVDVNGDFDAPFRVHYQIASMLKRGYASIVRATRHKREQALRQ